MSWLRVDDGFMQHPKFEGWRPSEKWAFLELMGYCAKYRTDGRIPTDLALLPRSVTPALLRRATDAGWLEIGSDKALWIHDWAIYNPKDATAASRSKAYRDRNANRNEHRDETVTSRGRDPVPSLDQKQNPKAVALNDARDEEQRPRELSPISDQIRQSLKEAKPR